MLMDLKHSRPNTFFNHEYFADLKNLLVYMAICLKIKDCDTPEDVFCSVSYCVVMLGQSMDGGDGADAVLVWSRKGCKLDVDAQS